VCRIEWLRRCEEEGRDGTRLGGCVKFYLPRPAGRWAESVEDQRQAGLARRPEDRRARARPSDPGPDSGAVQGRHLDRRHGWEDQKPSVAFEVQTSSAVDAPPTAIPFVSIVVWRFSPPLAPNGTPTAPALFRSRRIPLTRSSQRNSFCVPLLFTAVVFAVRIHFPPRGEGWRSSGPRRSKELRFPRWC
jgi:hypothetical protein